jgi:hypothetical protein
LTTVTAKPAFRLRRRRTVGAVGGRSIGIVVTRIL